MAYINSMQQFKATNKEKVRVVNINLAGTLHLDKVDVLWEKLERHNKKLQTPKEACFDRKRESLLEKNQS